MLDSSPPSGIIDNPPTDSSDSSDVSSRSREVSRSLQRLDRLAELMDDQFEIPIVGYRIGLDPLLGLLPGAGDWAAWVAGVYVFWVGLRLDVPNRILWRMIGNITADLVVGYVPGVGDLVDAMYKSNRKNVDLLLDHYDAHDPRRTPSELPAETDSTSALKRYTLGVGVTVLLTALAALPFLLIAWVF